MGENVADVTERVWVRQQDVNRHAASGHVHPDVTERNATAGDAPQEDATARDAPQEDAGSIDAPQEDATAGDAPQEDVTAGNAPQEDAGSIDGTSEGEEQERYRNRSVTAVTERNATARNAPQKINVQHNGNG